MTLLQQAWNEYRQAVETARQAIENRPLFARPEQKSPGYRCLFEAQAMAYNWAIAPRTDHPRIVSHTIWSTYYFTLAGNCTDFIYSALFLDGRRRYRLRGRFGEVRLLLLQVFNRSMGSEGARCLSNHELPKPQPGADDRIDIVLSAEQREGNWIALDATSRYNVVLIRRLMADWFDDKGELEIEALDPPIPYENSGDAALAERISTAGGFIKFVIQEWCIKLVDRFVARAGRPNAWVNIAGEQMAAMGGSATCNYAFLVYELDPDEALIIEMDVPSNSAFWSFQLFDVWSKSLDFMHAQTDVNMQRAWIDTDGRVRAVISLSDPGVANWLDSAGQTEGFCAMRNYLAETLPEPSLKRVKLSELRSHLPAETRFLSAEERCAALRHRRRGLSHLYDL